MKLLLTLASVVALSAAPALAADGHVSGSSLANMGLGGMKMMSDNDGLQVRGLSVAVVGGFSIATINGDGGNATSVNTYFAAGKHSASGNNISFASDTQIKTYGPYVVSTTTNIVAAGGASSAHAH